MFINIKPVITDPADVEFYKLRPDLSKLTFPDELFEYHDNCDDRTTTGIGRAQRGHNLAKNIPEKDGHYTISLMAVMAVMPVDLT